jgi:hypothetical protein
MNRTCNKCGWVAFGVSLGFARREVFRFNKWLDHQPESVKQELYDGKRASMDIYKKCLCCGGPYTNFRDSVEGDCPEGVTLNPIIDEALK